uniref:(northern house mosquito) hypothetical protein n=1 Tax=Culex pipiens TaxID=7175 RepID=A0A8D8N1C2_CULPI
MKGNSAELRSMLASSMPPTALLPCCTSFSSSDATARCLDRGCDNGDSSSGSIGSSGLIRWARMQIFGSDTSSTLSGPCWLASVVSGVGRGIPAGRNRSRLCTGMMKQSLSSVASEIGSLRELTKPPLPG